MIRDDDDQITIFFDYDYLTEQDRPFIEKAAEDIHGIDEEIGYLDNQIKTATDLMWEKVIERGRILTEVWTRLGHITKGFDAWLDFEKINRSTAYDCKNLYIRFVEKKEVELRELTEAGLGLTVIKMLASQAVPVEAIEQVVDEAKTNKPPTKQRAKEIIKEVKQQLKEEQEPQLPLESEPVFTPDYHQFLIGDNVKTLDGKTGKIYGIYDQSISVEVKDPYPAIVPYPKSEIFPIFEVGDKVYIPSKGKYAEIEGVNGKVALIDANRSKISLGYSELILVRDGYDPNQVNREIDIESDKPESETVLDAEIVETDKMAVHYSSKSDEHWTPQVILDAVLEVFKKGIDLDPCSNEGEPNVPAKQHFTKQDDGLSQHWNAERLFLNPPYGNEINKWVEKLVTEHTVSFLEGIALLPARTDTQWFRMLEQKGYLFCFIHGRLNFVNNEGSAPFPSVVVWLGEYKSQPCSRDKDFKKAFAKLGSVYRMES